MTVSAASASSPAAVEAEFTALVLKKHKDVQQDQAEALIQLVKTAVPEGTGRLIDVRV